MRILDCINSIENNDRIAPYGILALRLTLAVLWAAHWAFKAFVTGMDTTVAVFGKLGYPPIVAWGTVSLEVIGIITLLLGLYTRTMAVILLVILFPAVLVWLPKGFWFTQAGYEFPLVWCVLQIILAITGPGPFAMRTLLNRK